MGFVGVYLQKKYEEKVEKMAVAKDISLGKVIQAIVVEYFSRKKRRRQSA